MNDPGNLGTVIRTAYAAGADGIVLSKGSVDLYNPKVLRALQWEQYLKYLLYKMQTLNILRLL
ncbi:MAG: TrmH family RNA methyltransferase [Veillonella parvula]